MLMKTVLKKIIPVHTATLKEISDYTARFMELIYSPDFNKIEKYWANIKNWLRLHLRDFDSFRKGFVRAFDCR